MAEDQVVAGYENVGGQYKMVPITQIAPPEYALREAQTDSPDYQRLKDSVRVKGYLSNILVRELDESTADSPKYGLIDGLQRFTIGRELGVKEIPCRVVKMDDAEIAEAQIIANAVKVQTTPAQYSLQLRRILLSNPTLTKAELAKRLDMSEGWLNERLSLANLCKKGQDLLDQGAIKLLAAIALAKLQPKEEQEGFLHEAQVNSYPEFSGKVEARIKEIRAANRTGQKVGERQFVAVPQLRKAGELIPIVQDESDAMIDEIINLTNPQSIKDAVKETLKWALQLDPRSIEEKKKKEEAIKAAKAAETAAKLKEQADKKLADATARVTKLNEEAEAE